MSDLIQLLRETDGHTPGPWQVVSESMNDGSLGIGRHSDRFIVASVHNGPSLGDVLLNRHPVTQHANARLVALAPEMKAALESQRVIIDGLNDAQKGLRDALESHQAQIRELTEALREIAGMRGHTVRSFEEIRDGWKDACVIAFGQAADIADKALRQERGDE